VLVAIFARMRATKLCLKASRFRHAKLARVTLRSKTPWQNKKAGANAGPLQLPCKLDQ
jgi:hypothetical protein